MRARSSRGLRDDDDDGGDDDDDDDDGNDDDDDEDLCWLCGGIGSWVAREGGRRKWVKKKRTTRRDRVWGWCWLTRSGSSRKAEEEEEDVEKRLGRSAGVASAVEGDDGRGELNHDESNMGGGT
jgi:hypothetical protein